MANTERTLTNAGLRARRLSNRLGSNWKRRDTGYIRS